MCRRNADLTVAFDRKFDELSNGLAEIEAAYKAEQKTQEQLIDAANRIP